MVASRPTHLGIPRHRGGSCQRRRLQASHSPSNIARLAVVFGPMQLMRGREKRLRRNSVQLHHSETSPVYNPHNLELRTLRSLSLGQAPHGHATAGGRGAWHRARHLQHTTYPQAMLARHTPNLNWAGDRIEQACKLTQQNYCELWANAGDIRPSTTQIPATPS